MKYVMAANHQAFTDWLHRQQEYARTEVEYVGTPTAFQGLVLKPSDVIQLPGWQKHPQAKEIDRQAYFAMVRGGSD